MFADVVLVLTLLLTLATVVVPFVNLERPSLNHSIEATPLIHAPSGVTPELRILYDGHVLDDPYLYALRLILRGRKEMGTSQFDKNRPIRLLLDVPVVALLETEFSPASLPLPEVRLRNNAVEIGPDLIRARQGMRFAVLADGPDAELKCENPVLGFSERQLKDRDRRYLISMVQPVLAWALVALILYWVIADPTGAAHFIHNL
jgi:hypothetical protein